jgi:hypothetical protein
LQHNYGRAAKHSTEGIIDNCYAACNWLFAETGRIRSLCSYPWLEQVSN